MLTRTRSVLLAASLLALPMAAAMAQQNNPAGNQGSNKSITASPGTADNKSAPGMNTSDAGSNTTMTSNYGGTTMPGSTGKTVVRGSNSTPSGTAEATNQQKTGSVSTSNR